MDVDVSGYNSKGDLVADLPTDPEFLTRAFDTLEGDEPLLEEMGNRGYFLLVVDNVTVRALRPFADVKTSVRDIWMADAAKNMAREKANELLAKVQDGISLEELAKDSAEISFTSVSLGPQ